MSDGFPGNDGYGDTRGWDRASIANRSSKPYVPDLTQEDLLLPNEVGRLQNALICSGCAALATLLYVGAPLYLVSLFVPMGPWFLGSLLAVAAVLAVSLTLYSSHETREFRKLAREL